MNTNDIIKEITDARGAIELPASGISMGKEWGQISTLTVQSSKQRDIAWADVVVYAVKEGLVAHRVVKKVNRQGVWWITKGDGCWSPDRLPVSDEDILGVVSEVVRVGRRVRINSGAHRMRGVFHALVGYVGTIIWPPIWNRP